MVDNRDDKPDKFDQYGQAEGYISLDQARVHAMQAATESPGAYGSRLSGVPMAFEVVSEEETEDYYVITLSFPTARPVCGDTGPGAVLH